MPSFQLSRMNIYQAIQIWFHNKWNLFMLSGFSINLGSIFSANDIQIILSALTGISLFVIGVWGKIRNERRKQEAHDKEQKRLDDLHRLEIQKRKEDLEE